MADRPEKPSDIEEKSKRSRVGCLIVGTILLPVFYLLSEPWVWFGMSYLLEPIPSWMEALLNGFYYPVNRLYENSEVFQYVQEWNLYVFRRVVIFLSE